MKKRSGAPIRPASNFGDPRQKDKVKLAAKVASNLPSSFVEGLFGEGLGLHKAGRLAEAEKIYRQVLALEPGHFNSLHFLGVIFHQRGHHEQAVQQFDLALKRNPKHSSALNNRGAALYALRHYDEALASYDRALTQQPDYAEALFGRGNALQKLNRYKDALASYDRALTLRPTYAEALSNRGISLRELSRYEEALASYGRALTLRPDYVEAHYNRGTALHELKRYEEALASYDRALTLRPHSPAVLRNRGDSLQQLKRYHEALASYDRALTLQPDYAEAFCARGNAMQQLKRYEEALANYDHALILRSDYAEALSNRAAGLHELKRFDEALASYDRALALRPDYAEALSNRGNTLRELKRYDEALASYDRALTLQPDYAEALSNRAATLNELKRFDEALANYDRAVTLRPDHADVHHNEALCRLLMGNFDQGWEQYEWRWQTEQLRDAKRNFAQPLWTGREDIAGKTILLHAEQGFGDTIQFSRYLPLVVERAAQVILEVQRPLHELLSTLSGSLQIISRDDPLPDFDIHCPLLSLPLAFGTRLETIPSATSYLHASPEVVAHWNSRLGDRCRPRIGLAWSGRQAHTNDHNRSIRFSALLPLLDFKATYVSLQQDVRPGDASVLQNRSELLHFGDDLKTFADTAALMSNLDLIISVDTSVAHLAGALAKPVWVLLPYIPDWRWLLDREDSPWYPTARLFRQDERREWNSVIARVQAQLYDFVGTF
jgi:tetratricopeptide (TPR) repeat protein